MAGTEGEQMKKQKRKVYGSEQIVSEYCTFTPEDLIQAREGKIKELQNQGVLGDIMITFEIDKYMHDYDPNNYYGVFIKWEHLETDSQYSKRIKKEDAQKAQELEHKRRQFEALKKELSE